MLIIKERFINKGFFLCAMNLYEIKEKLKKQEKSVFNLNEISRITGKKKSIVSIYINRMQKKGWLFKLEKNKISITKDIFVVSSQLTFPSYLSLTTSLYLHNIIPQVIDKIYMITPKKKKKTEVFSTKVFFIKTSPKMMFGYRKIKKGEGFIFIADLEKTIIDCLLFLRYCRINDVVEAIKQADIEKLGNYLFMLKKESAIRRCGYLLDLLKIKHNLKKKTKTIYKLNPSSKKKGKFNNKWYLYINEEIK